MAQAHAVAGSFQALLQPGRGDLDHAGQAVVRAYAGVEHDRHVQQEGGALEHAVDGPGRQRPVQPDPAFPAVGRQGDDDHHRESDDGDQNVDTRSCDEAGNGVERGERAGPRDWVGEPGQAGDHAIGHDAQQEHHHGGQRRGIEQRLPDGGADPGLGLDQGDGIAHGLNQVAAHLAGLDQRSLLGGQIERHGGGQTLAVGQPHQRFATGDGHRMKRMLSLMSEDLVYLCHSVLQRDPVFEQGGHAFVELQAFLATELLAVEGELQLLPEAPHQHASCE